MSTIVRDLYDEDFYLWTRRQAAELRRMAKARTNTALDLEHLAEEIADLGKSERRGVESHVERIIEHLSKLQHSPATEPRAGWMESIVESRNRLARDLTPTLRRHLERDLDDLYAGVVRKLSVGLTERGEREAAKALPARCPFSLNDVTESSAMPMLVGTL
jgi:hypothetical protein